MSESMSSFFEGLEFGDNPSFSKLPESPEALFSIFDALEGFQEGEETMSRGLGFQAVSDEAELDEQPKRKRAKIIRDEEDEDNSKTMSHIAVERNRRKQMNEHISVLRSLMPCFYVKRGDQASIIGGVVDYISELQQVLQSLEAKKQRKAYSEVLSPRVLSSPRLLPPLSSSPRLNSNIPLSPRTPQPSSPYNNIIIRPRILTTTSIDLSPQQVLSPRLLPPPLSSSPMLNSNLPLSPRTPQPSSPYNNIIRPRIITTTHPIDLLSSSSSHSSSTSSMNDELVANSKSPLAEVEVKFSGSNLLLKTISTRIPGHVAKIVSTLEDLFLEILQISISSYEDTMLTSFTIKIGIECKLSAEELAHQIQQTFCFLVDTS